MEPVAPSEALRNCIAKCFSIRELLAARRRGTLGQRDAVEAELGRLIETLAWTSDMMQGIAGVNRELHEAQRRCIACLRLVAYPHVVEQSLQAIERHCAVVLGRVGR